MGKHPEQRRSFADSERLDELFSVLQEAKSPDEIEAKLQEGKLAPPQPHSDEEVKRHREGVVVGALRPLPYVVAITRAQPEEEGDLVVTLAPGVAPFETVHILVKQDRSSLDKFKASIQDDPAARPLAKWQKDHTMVLFHGKMDRGGIVGSFESQVDRIVSYPGK
jgi:hypothetical protein